MRVGEIFSLGGDCGGREHHKDHGHRGYNGDKGHDNGYRHYKSYDHDYKSYGGYGDYGRGYYHSRGLLGLGVRISL